MRKKRWIILPFLIFFIGFVYTSLVYDGIWFKFVDGLQTLSIIGYFLWLIFAFYLTLALHELGHFIAFAVQKVKLRALYLTIFVFFKDEKGWHFRIKPKLWVLFGGLVVPDLRDIKDEKAYEELSKKFARSLITAPIVTITFMVLSLLTFVLILIFGNYPHLLGIISINTLYITLLSSLYIYTFKLSNPMFYGDFVAYRKMKEDHVFQLAQISQYTMFSLGESEDSERYLWERSKQTIESEPVSVSLFCIMVLTNYIDGILHHGYAHDLMLDSKLSQISLPALCRTEQGLSLAYDLCFYDYYRGNPEGAYQKFDRIQKRTNQKLDPKMVLYMRNRAAHLIHLEDQSLFLDNQENLYIGNAWIFDALMKPYEMLKAYHNPLPYVEYSCPVVLLEEQKSDLN